MRDGAKTNLLKASLTGAVAAVMLTAAAGPSLALPNGYGNAYVASGRHESERSTFHRHFYRGQHLHGPRNGLALGGMLDDDDASVGLVDGAAYRGEIEAEDAGQMDDAVGYCADRFQSYDLGSGTYLGYDGVRHSCP